MMSFNVIAAFLVWTSLAVVPSGGSVPPELPGSLPAAADIKVPPVVGKTEVEARKALAGVGLGCTVDTITVIVSRYMGKEGRVLRQVPEGGTWIAGKGTVMIVVYRPVAPAIRWQFRPQPRLQPGFKPKVVVPGGTTSVPHVNLLLWGWTSANMLPEGLPSEFYVFRTGSGKLTKPVVVAWEIFGQNDASLFRERMTFDLAKLYSKPNGPTGQFEIASSGIVLPVLYERVACKAVLTVDPDGSIDETDENDNTFELRFGRCESVPLPADPAKVVDIYPEFSPDMAGPPDAYGARHLKFRLTNRGSTDLRQPIKFTVILRTTDMDVYAQRELAATDLPVKAGASRVADGQFSFSEKYNAIAKAVDIYLDTDYRVPESDKRNNIATFPYGLGQLSPESDPNARPDLMASLSGIEVETVGTGYALVKGRVDNVGPVRAPRQGSGVDLELAVWDKAGAEIYLDRRSADAAVAAGSNIVFEFQKMPLAVFQKACELRLTADPDGRIPESDEGNNVFVKPLEFCGQDPPLPDLKALKIEVRRSAEQYVYSFHFKNVGNDRVRKGYSVSWSFDGETPISLASSLFLEPQETTAWVFSVPLSNYPQDKKSVRVRVDLNDGVATGPIQEHNMTNNSLEVELALPSS